MIKSVVFALIAVTCYAQAPVWTDIMNQTGFSNMASGTFWQFAAGNDQQITSTSIGARPNLKVAGASANEWQAVCNRTITTPVQFLESNFGTGLKGVGFLGTFGGSSIPGSSFGPGAYLFESVFFSEQYCYNGGREYGFFYDPYGNGTWFYWGTNENLASEVQAQALIPNVLPNVEYYFEIYPVAIGSTCNFQVTVLNTSFASVYSALVPVGSNNYPAGQSITKADPGFCSAVTSPESGYVTTTVQYSPTITNLPATIDLNLQRVFVGK